MKSEKIIRWIFTWIGAFFAIAFLAYLIGADRFPARFFAFVIAVAAIVDLVYNHLPNKPKTSIKQSGKTVYIRQGDNTVCVCLDSDRPLTEEELQAILRDVEAFHAK